MSARSELSAELEEQSYRWRSGRLADLGYVDFYDALDLFRPLTPDQVKIGEGTEDRVIPPDTQRQMAQRAGATITEVAGSHVSMVSHPGATIEAILAAAAA